MVDEPVYRPANEQKVFVPRAIQPAPSPIPSQRPVSEVSGVEAPATPVAPQIAGRSEAPQAALASRYELS
jgi:hypothetical protein